LTPFATACGRTVHYNCVEPHYSQCNPCQRRRDLVPDVDRVDDGATCSVAVRGRTKRIMNLSIKILHPSDSQATFRTTPLHISPALSTQYLVQKVATLELAAALSPMREFNHSHRNAADTPGRDCQWKKGQLVNCKCEACACWVYRNHCFLHSRHNTFCMQCKGYEIRSLGPGSALTGLDAPSPEETKGASEARTQ